MPQRRLAAVGAFVLGGLVLFATGLFLIGDRRMLFSDTFTVYAEFSQIASLETGGKVRVSGMDAGEVEEIRVPAGPSAKFRVQMRVRRDLQPLIRVDSVASIQNDGLVGNKFVQIQTGSDGAAPVEDGGTIQSREPLDLADLLQMMSDTLVTVNAMLVDVKGRVDEALVAVTSTAEDVQVLMEEVGGEVQTILASGDRIAANLSDIVAGVQAGRGTVGKLLTEDALYTSVKNIVADAEKAVATVKEASQDARDAIAELRGEKSPVKGLTGDVQQTLQSARDAMTDLADATEALKRNFFLRGFFNRRGYFDLDDVSVAQYRAGALEAGDRRALRLWLRSGLVFERGTNGDERLGPDGMARLDSAMSQFVKYPRTSPFVVEGYAEGVTADERYLISRARAQLVRDYLVGKYKLDSDYVTIMPMGNRAEGSPDGDHWDGVALAMFVPEKALSSPR
jgi:phospholipid/cholesterol/gamma-HCH transport system substrate-binding protein